MGFLGSVWFHAVTELIVTEKLDLERGDSVHLAWPACGVRACVRGVT